jgi:hypothetical protein
MSDHETKPGGHLNRWLIAAVLFLVVYPLSGGPLVFMDAAGYRPSQAIMVLYWPLDQCARVPVVGRLLEIYTDACRQAGRWFRHP